MDHALRVLFFKKGMQIMYQCGLFRGFTTATVSLVKAAIDATFPKIMSAKIARSLASRCSHFCVFNLGVKKAKCF